MAIDYGGSYEPEWRLYRVDERTWADAELVGSFSDATIDRSPEQTMESGSFTALLPAGNLFERGYYRLAMVARQSGAVERVDLSTLLCEMTAGTIEHGHNVATVTGGSVLTPAHRQGMPIGKAAPAGCDGVDWAASLLSGCLARPVEASGSFTLDTGLAFKPTDSKLAAAWQVLEAGGWCIQVDGRGVVYVLRKPEEPALLLDEAGARLLLPSVSYELDYSLVPNRYRAMDGSEYAEAVNDDPASERSVPSLGYYDDGEAKFDDSPTRVNGETLPAYCARKLEEASTMPDSRTYTREYWPGVLPYSIVRGSLALDGLEGDMRVSRQSIETSDGILVTEEARKEVKLWKA